MRFERQKQEAARNPELPAVFWHVIDGEAVCLDIKYAARSARIPFDNTRGVTKKGITTHCDGCTKVR